MIDSQHFALQRAEDSNILEELGLEAQNYVLVTLHRPSNVDDNAQLSDLLGALLQLSKKIKIVFPAHPRSIARMESFGLMDKIKTHPNFQLIGPQGYVRFLRLSSSSKFIITDSGGLQEESTALGVTCLTVRTTTERPITVDLGTNSLVTPTGSALLEASEEVLAGNTKEGKVPMFWDGRTGQRIARRIHAILFPQQDGS